ncbi:GIY-YIG nuclease family protein [Cochleicola gelatinilyticus]|uniref:GIY-YIG nuclease family protein n=1 Tax=Cochleicola gelatinilyticus TaxID=1763537 RepID=UPI0009EDADCC|nr:GIY-YIG nuclease family protein [Cochleicola gelatinilyticus]
MSHLVYILYSSSISQYYCGETSNIEDRLLRHNGGRSKSTKRGIPWVLIRTIDCIDRSDARILESRIKKRGISRWLEANPE